MKKKICIIGLLLALCFVVSGCSRISKTPNEQQCLSDYLAKNTEVAYANFNTSQFIRQQLNKENEQFIADVKLTGKDDYANYEGEVRLIYNYYDDQGWMLDEYSKAVINCICYKGRTQEQIITDIQQLYSSEKYLTDIEYISHTFEQENNCEKAIIDVVTRVGYVDRTNRYEMTFYYEEGKWKKKAHGGSRYGNEIDDASSIYLNIKNTTWYSNNEGDPDVKILDVSEDSSVITFMYGNDGPYKAVPDSSWYGRPTLKAHDSEYDLRFKIDSDVFYSLYISNHSNDDIDIHLEPSPNGKITYYKIKK